jgi:ribosome-associated toxin RatA of RatAB toxin-antitoxin module
MVCMTRSLFLSLVLVLAAPAAARADVPSVRDLGIDAAAVAPLIGDAQLVLLHKEKPYAWRRDGETHKKKAMFISCLQVVNAPVAAARAVVLDVAKFPAFVPEFQKVKVRDEGGRKIAAIESVNNAVVMNFDVDYAVAVSEEAGGDVRWTLVEGDMDEFAARWEFFPLPGDKTLLAYTSWQDVESISFTVRTIMKAQPDFRTVIPATTAAVLMGAVAKHASGGAPAAKTVVKEPVTPMLSTGASSASVAAMRKLAETGTFMLVHPVQYWKDKKGKTRELLFTSAGAIVNMPAAKAKETVLHVERLPEYLPQQVDRVTPVAGAPVPTYDLKLKVGISILTVSVNYTLAYDPVTPLAVSFRDVKGDMAIVRGAWEFFDVGDGKSLVYYTTASIVGQDASAILRVGEDKPNRDLIVGISSTALTIQKLLPWLAKQ